LYASALDFQGLYTFPNPLAKVPVGACLVANNLVSNRDGIAESRRGTHAVGNAIGTSSGSSNGVYSYIPFQNRLLINGSGFGSGGSDLASGLGYDSTGTFDWVNSGGTGWEGPSESGYRLRYQEANKNMYFINAGASGLGIAKLQAYSSTPVFAGVPAGLDGTGVLAGSGSGFLGAAFQCAYQIVFGYTDLNGNLNLGAPSERILVVNSTGGSDNVTLTFTVPQGLSTSYFYQIYRTPQTAYSATPSLNVPPGAEPQLSAQFNLTSGQVSALSVTYTDVTTDALLGAALYTNPSQEGALQSNDQPPFALDMCVYSQMMFYANCQTIQSVELSMISVGSPNGVQVGDTITVNGITFTAANSQNNASQEFQVTTGGTVASNIDATARALIQCINANAASTFVYAIYLSGYGDLPGLIDLQGINLTTSVFYVTASRGGAFYPTLPSTGTTFGSSNDQVPNGIYVSKLGQPEAVPAVNLLFVGGGDQPIYRVLPLRDEVIVLKSDGVYVITGSSPSTLSITLLDSTIICIAPDSARLLNNSVYCLSQQGVVSITESGVTIQSRAIESDLLSLAAQTYTNNSFTNMVYGISYESERLYILCMPTATTDKLATQEFCYNWVTNSWTKWTMDVLAGVVNPYDNVLYLSRPITNNNYIYQERKTYTYADFFDDQYPVTITNIAAVSNNQQVITLQAGSGISTSWVGYGLDQTINGTDYIAIIDAVNVGANTITIDYLNTSMPGATIPWALTTAAVDVPIQITYQQCPITAGFPHYVKEWGRVNYWFNSGNFTQITSYIYTDANYGSPGTIQSLLMQGFGGGYGFDPYGSSSYGGSYNYMGSIQTLSPIGQGRFIVPQLSLAFPQARFSCMGVTASYDIVSDVTG
jgi:hypothetical protein